MVLPLSLVHVDVELFKTLDGADIFTLRGAAEVWRQSFDSAEEHSKQRGYDEQ